MTEVVLQQESDSAGQSGAVITADEITVRFGGIVALDKVTVHVARGQRCGIIGPNGAGKTTFLDVLSGMRRPTSGHVQFENRNVSKEGPTRVSRRGLRRTFQRQQPFGWLSVEENVLMALEWPGRGPRLGADLLGLRSQGRRKARLMTKVDEVLEQCGLSNVRTQPAASLPIGKVRLLEFARAIADRPKLLLLDEPTSGLFHQDSERLGEAMQQINKSSDCAYVLVEHDVEFVVATCNRLVVLDQGAILSDGDPAQVLKDPAVIDAYLGQEQEVQGAEG
jgi:branched-chain amino acid transport system ATP-binding protein